MFTRIFALAAFILVACSVATAQAADRLSLIRDAEIENNIRAFATPLFQAAGLDPEAVQVHLVKDAQLNAFVANGQNLFLNTGLLIRAEHAGQVIGVIAHETGHISGGHLARAQGAFENASTEAILAMVLGGAVAAASGRGDVAGAVMMGGSQMAERNLLAFSRTQEASADQAALGFLDGTRQSARGLLEFFEILGDQELLVAARQDPYVRTHPLTRERVTTVRNHVETSPFSDVPVRPEFVEMHKRIRAKLFAFIESPMRVFQRYREEDNSLDARYARAIAYYRKPDMEKAVPAIDQLIAERPNDPYFHELKGQMLFENARLPEALVSYKESVRLLPNQPLLRISLAQVEIELEDQQYLDDAIGNLNYALKIEPNNRFAWNLTAIAYGRQGNEGMASYAMAEQSLLSGKLPEAQYHAGRAEMMLPKGSPVRLRVQDIKEQAAIAKEEKARK